MDNIECSFKFAIVELLGKECIVFIREKRKYELYWQIQKHWEAIIIKKYKTDDWYPCICYYN